MVVFGGTRFVHTFRGTLWWWYTKVEPEVSGSGTLKREVERGAREGERSRSLGPLAYRPLAPPPCPHTFHATLELTLTAPHGYSGGLCTAVPVHHLARARTSSGEPWERSDHGGGSPVHQAIQPWGTKFLGHKDPHGWIIRLGVTG